MAVNKPVGDNSRKGAVRNRSQLATKTQGTSTWTKRAAAKVRRAGSSSRRRKARSTRAFDGKEQGDEVGISISAYTQQQATPEDIMKSLNSLGEQGWEMAGSLPSEVGTLIIL